MKWIYDEHIKSYDFQDRVTSNDSWNLKCISKTTIWANDSKCMIYLQHIHKSRFAWSIIDLVQLLTCFEDNVIVEIMEEWEKKPLLLETLYPSIFINDIINETPVVTKQWVSIEKLIVHSLDIVCRFKILLRHQFWWIISEMISTAWDIWLHSLVFAWF